MNSSTGSASVFRRSPSRRSRCRQRTCPSTQFFTSTSGQSSPRSRPASGRPATSSRDCSTWARLLDIHPSWDHRKSCDLFVRRMDFNAISARGRPMLGCDRIVSRFDDAPCGRAGGVARRKEADGAVLNGLAVQSHPPVDFRSVGPAATDDRNQKRTNRDPNRSLWEDAHRCACSLGGKDVFQNGGMASPPSIVANARHVVRLIESLMKCTDPSAKTTWTPPGCRLRAAQVLSFVSSLALLPKYEGKFSAGRLKHQVGSL